MQAIRKKDEDVIQYITNVTANRTEDPQTISIAIDFRENEYFKNKQLTLSVILKDGSNSEVKETIGCEIEWKDGKDLTKKKI